MSLSDLSSLTTGAGGMDQQYSEARAHCGPDSGGRHL